MILKPDKSIAVSATTTVVVIPSKDILGFQRRLGSGDGIDKPLDRFQHTAKLCG